VVLESRLPLTQSSDLEKLDCIAPLEEPACSILGSSLAALY